MFDDIPEELKQCKAWVVWQYATLDNGKITKHPHNARTGHMASVTNPADWSSFDEAVSAASNYSGVGFVLSAADPYTVIDLDASEDAAEQAMQVQISRTFNSFSEVSPSGRGLHIWIKGSVPKGTRRGNVEVYSTARYMTVTGAVFNSADIAGFQLDLTALYNKLGGKPDTRFEVVGDPDIKHPDAAICDMAYKAANGDKFLSLYKGDWANLNYQSQSEADFALIDIIAFYSNNMAQVARIFRSSGLG